MWWGLEKKECVRWFTSHVSSEADELSLYISHRSSNLRTLVDVPAPVAIRINSPLSIAQLPSHSLTGATKEAIIFRSEITSCGERISTLRLIPSDLHLALSCSSVPNLFQAHSHFLRQFSLERHNYNDLLKVAKRQYYDSEQSIKSATKSFATS